MTGRGFRARAAVFEPLCRQLLHQRMQMQACLLLAQQRLVRQRTEDGQRCARDGPRRLGREASREHRQPRKRLALDFTQQTPRVVEHDVDARVPWRLCGIDGVQQLGSLPQFGRDGITRQHARPGRSQFQRQRQAFDLPADLDDGRGLLGGDKFRMHAMGCTHEKAHRIESFDPVAVLVLRARKAFERHQPLHRQCQPNARCHQELHAGTLGQQPFQLRRAVDELFEVVQHQQHPAVAQRLDHLLDRLGAALEPDFQFLRDASPDLVRRCQIVQGDKGCADVMAGGQFIESMTREPRLADPARSGQAQQAAIAL